MYLPTDGIYGLVGNNKGMNGGFVGWMDEIRISKGVARYTDTFTPPAVPHPDPPVIGLPTAVGNTNRYALKNDSVSETILVAAPSGQTIEGSQTIEVPPGDSRDVVSKGIGWGVI